MPTLSEQCDPRHPLKKLGERIPWSDFEEAFGEYYSEEGRPAKPVRLMVGLLLLKQMYDQSDEEVVERWVENPYWQQFCGMSDFQWEWPCDPSDLVYFRQRIGEQGVALILAVSAQLHGARVQEREVVVESTVQEKNVTYPVDTKQYRKIIMRCWKLSDKSGIRLRRRYRKEVRACIMAQRLRKDPRRRKAARRGHRRLRTICRSLNPRTGAQVAGSSPGGTRRELHPLPSGPGPKASGYQQDLFLTRAAHLLCSQRQGAQEIRIWHQSFGGHDQNPRRHRGGGGP